MQLTKMNEVIVVEGKNDTHAIRRAVQADTIETNGSAIPEHVLQEIERVATTRGVIVFTDPDAAGERIRRIVSKRVPGVKHAFVSRELAKKQQKVGVEFASPDIIVHALSAVRQEAQDVRPLLEPISYEEYIDIGFIGRADSSHFRRLVAQKLGIGYANAQQFFRRLTLLQVSRAELRQAIELVKRGQTS